MSEACGALVIGGAGFIGSHLVPQLVETGRRVTVLGRSAAPRNQLPGEVSYVAGSFEDLGLLRSLLDGHQEVVHLAHASVPKTSFENPLRDLSDNVVPAVPMYYEIAIRGIKLVLISSGGTVYGESIESPIREDHPTRPISPYGVSKLALESYANLYAVTHGLSYVCLRPGNPFGVGQRSFQGQGFIATAIGSSLQNIPVKIFGDCGTVRDYLYASDLARGIVCALESGRRCETYNLGSGIGRSNLDVVLELEPLMREVGYEIALEKLPKRVFDVQSNILDSSRLERDTGWKQEVEFEAGLVLTRDWLIGQLT